MASRRRRDRNSKQEREERRLTVRGIRRDPPDIRKLSKALIGLAMAEAEREAQAEQAARQRAVASEDEQRPEDGRDA